MKKHAVSLVFVYTLFALAITQIVAPPRAWADPGVLTKGDNGKNGGQNGKKTGNDVSGGRFSGDPIYVHIDPMIMPIIDDNGVEQLVTILFQVQVKDFNAADAMQSHMPQIMDALMSKLYGDLGSGALRNGKLVNVGKIKQRAIAAVGGVIGADNVQDVLVQSIAQRML